MKPRRQYITLEKELVDIIDSAGDEPVLIEDGDLAGHYIVPHAAFEEKIAPLLLRVPMSHPLAAVRRYIDAEVNDHLWESCEDEAEEFSIQNDAVMMRKVAFRALVLQVLYSVPTQQLLEELVSQNLLYRWFYDDQFLLFDPPSSEEIERELDSIQPEDNVGKLLAAVVEMTKTAAVPNKDYFTPDHALLTQWCSRC